VVSLREEGVSTSKKDLITRTKKLNIIKTSRNSVKAKQNNDLDFVMKIEENYD
jgi:hypothetical protein